jgi:hypothetical protein
MNYIKNKINKIIITDNEFILECNNINYISYITSGSVNFLLYNEYNEEINLCNLEENDIIKIFFIKDNNNNNIIKKILMKNKYKIT